jgi:cytochrome P450
MLSMLINARDEDGQGLTETELISEAFNILDQDTTASGLIFTILLLAQHPEVSADLLDELQGVLHGEAPTIEHLEKLPLLERVIKESMRLLPPAPFTRRFTAQPCQFGPYQLGKGVPIFFSQYITQRLPEIYSEPKRFKPERWESLKPSLYEYFPFGAGAHYCLGAGFAMQNMKLVLAILLQRYKLSVVPGTRIDRTIRLKLLLIKQGLPMKISLQDRQFSRSSIRGTITEMVDFA